MSNKISTLKLSHAHSIKRMEQIRKVLGSSVIDKIMALTLFLLGAKRTDIAVFLGIPLGTLHSFFLRINKSGLYALTDRRESPRAIENRPPQFLCCVQDRNIVIRSGTESCSLKLSQKDLLQQKTLLFTFLENGLLSRKEVSDALKLSLRHIDKLRATIQKEGIVSLLDNRRGQLKDYKFTPENKAEVIQQFVVNVMTEKSTSGQTLSDDIKQRCGLDLSSRSIRSQKCKLGLTEINKSFLSLLNSEKKT